MFYFFRQKSLHLRDLRSRCLQFILTHAAFRALIWYGNGSECNRNGIYLVPAGTSNADCFSSIKIPTASRRPTPPRDAVELCVPCASFVLGNPTLAFSWSDTVTIDSASIDELFSSCAITPTDFNCLFNGPLICKTVNHGDALSNTDRYNTMADRRFALF